MQFADAAALILGAILIGSGVRAIRRRRADVPERYEGARAVGLGWLWIALGTLFIAGTLFDLAAVKAVFHLFLEAAN